MGKGKVMEESLERVVDSELRGFFREYDFRKAQTYSSDDFDCVVYDSPRCRLAFCESMRDGSVNCLIAKLGVPAEVSQDNGWHPYGSLFDDYGKVSLEEAKRRLPPRMGFEDQVAFAAKRIRGRYLEILSNLDKRGC